MKAQALLSRLQRVKQTGPETWLARCPAHDDKHPSLGIRETKDGVVLVRCYAQQCGVDAIAAAVGIDLAELFPDTKVDQHRGWRRPFPFGDVLEAVSAEIEIVMIIAGDLLEDREVSADDYVRLKQAVDRLREARRVALA